MKKKTDADKAKAKIKDATKTVTKSGRTIKVSASSSYPKDIKKGSMISNSRIVEVKPAKKTSTSYSPAPMTAAAKKKAANRGALSNSLSKMGFKQVNLDKKAKKK